jgi:hypothetical protein
MPQARSDRSELIARHTEAKRRRDAAPLDSRDFAAAAEEVARIEVEIASREQRPAEADQRPAEAERGPRQRDR